METVIIYHGRKTVPKRLVPGALHRSNAKGICFTWPPEDGTRPVKPLAPLGGACRIHTNGKHRVRTYHGPLNKKTDERPRSLCNFVSPSLAHSPSLDACKRVGFAVYFYLPLHSYRVLWLQATYCIQLWLVPSVMKPFSPPHTRTAPFFSFSFLRGWLALIPSGMMFSRFQVRI